MANYIQQTLYIQKTAVSMYKHVTGILPIILLGFSLAEHCILLVRPSNLNKNESVQHGNLQCSLLCFTYCYSTNIYVDSQQFSFDGSTVPGEQYSNSKLFAHRWQCVHSGDSVVNIPPSPRNFGTYMGQNSQQ